MSVARLSVGVDQLSYDYECTGGDMKRPDDIDEVYGQMSGSQYVCTVCTEESEVCRCVGSDAIGREAANQESPSRFKNQSRRRGDFP